ncbi:UDP-N-acetylmuramoyl-L-alanine--D-glutamate ligase [bacterium]|nr:UDP-N-acetylmuramoyl-L-alanine--D-glutamate ligase [bacterium]
MFFNLVKNPIIAVTGTRGKTTTTNWIAHFLKAKWPNVQIAGNTPDNPLLNAISSLEKDSKTPVVVELSSWQLEFLDRADRAPDIAVITNLYEDHMNRYSSMEEYAMAKANIFKNQTKEQTLILNKDNEWTKWSLEQKPKSKILYSSSAELTTGGITTGIDGEHNTENLRMAFVVANSMGISWKELGDLTSSLPSVRFRQQYIYENDKLLIVNDSASTSPDAGIAAIRWFPEEARRKHLPLFLIAGGTDKGLSYEKWAEVLASEISRYRDAERLEFHLFLLEGSATDKMEKALSKYRDVEMSKYQDLETLVQDVKKKIDEAGGGIIVFSPGAASFEKFKNEFDRGEQFGALAKKYLVI